MTMETNIFATAAQEVIEAFALIDEGSSYCTTLLNMNTQQRVSKTRLPGVDAINNSVERFFNAEDDIQGRVMVRDVRIGSNLGKIDGIVVDVLDFSSMNYLQLLYPYQAPEHDQPLRIHRLQLIGAKGFSSDEMQSLRIAQFFDGLESAELFAVFANRNTNQSVELA